MSTKAERERKATADAVDSTLKLLFSGSLTPFQISKIKVAVRMSYYLGLIDGKAQHEAVAKALNGKEEGKCSSVSTACNAQ